MTKYLMEVSDRKYCEFNLHSDWYEHHDIVKTTHQEFVLWDPWYNRLLRYLFNGHYKKLKLHGQSQGYSNKA